MKDYNTITAELLKNAPHGIDCYVSNVSYADALQDIHCTGDAVELIIGSHQLSSGQWVFFNNVGVQSHLYTIPVHLVVKELLDGCGSLLERLPCEDATDRDKSLCDFLWHID